MPDGVAPFDQAITDAIEARTVAERNMPTTEGYHRVDSLNRTSNGRLEGLFLRLRTDASAVTAGLEQEGLQGLRLRPGEVLTEYFGFLYVPETRVLVIHRNRDAGRQGRLESYSEHLVGASPIRFAAVVAGSALKRVTELTNVKKAHLVIANPENLSDVDAEGPVLQVARVAHRAGAALVEVNISVANTGRHLNRSFVSAVLDLLHLKTSAIKAATVTGEEDGEVVLLDLVKDAMRETVVVEGDGPLTPNQVFMALNQAYSRMEVEIRRVYRVPGD